MTNESPLGNAGYGVFGSGGGGEGGAYVFASLEELDSVIGAWTEIYNGVVADRAKLVRAQGMIGPPADDIMSVGQAEAMVDSLAKAIDHNKAMSEYMEFYIAKLTAARNQYITDDERSAADLRGIDGQ